MLWKGVMELGRRISYKYFLNKQRDFGLKTRDVKVWRIDEIAGECPFSKKCIVFKMFIKK